MNLELTSEQTALRDNVRRFLAEKASIDTHVRPLLDDDTGRTDEVWRGLADLGATGLLVGPEFDGAGATMVEAGVVAEEMGAALHPGPWLSTAVAAPRALARFEVADDLAGPLLTGIADGSTVVTVGPLEGPRPQPAHGSGTAALRGQIGTVWDAAAADVVLVVADDHDGAALFAVPADRVTLSRRSSIDQSRRCFDIRLDDAPAQRLAVAAPNAVDALVDDVTIAWAADALGAARAVLGLAVEYAQVRRQFGQPIGAFQAVQHLLVDMYETVELARSGVVHALWAADAGNHLERRAAALRAKAFAGRLASVGDTAIQVFGGIGYTWDHDAGLYLKRLLGWSSFRGSSDSYLVALGARFTESVLS